MCGSLLLKQCLTDNMNFCFINIFLMQVIRCNTIFACNLVFFFNWKISEATVDFRLGDYMSFS